MPSYQLAKKTALDTETARAIAAEAAALARANHTGTQSADTLTDGTTNKAFLATERTKLAGLTALGEGINFVTASTTADNAVTNGTALRAAYAAAKVLTPNGAALSATNRAVLFVPPGKYDLVTTPLTMDTQFVDLVGLSNNAEHVLITSAVATTDSGTLVQTANDVLISGVTLENTQNSNAQTLDRFDPAAYAPSTSLAMTKMRGVNMVGSGLGRAMRLGTIYPGSFTDCTGGDYSFGGSPNGTASGSFTNCTGGDYSFGGIGGTASGSFRNCTGGAYSFGGAYGYAIGTFRNCTGGAYSFGGASGGASGSFTNCTGGDYSFGESGGASGSFTNCTGGAYSFASGGSASGVFTGCVAGANSFGSNPGVASGTFTNCKAADDSFGYQCEASGVFTNCTAGGTSFGASVAASGTFTNCTAGNTSFGVAANASGVFTNCKGGLNSFGTFGVLTGKLFNCVLVGFGTFETVEARTFTVTIANPGVFTLASHGFATGAVIRFTTTGALPTGLAVATSYVVTNLTSSTFKVSATTGGADIVTTGTQSGTHSVRSGRVINGIDGYSNLNNQ